MERIRVDDKYTIVKDIDGSRGVFVFKCLRYDEEWRDLTGDNLILAMAHRIEELEYELLESGVRAELE